MKTKFTLLLCIFVLLFACDKSDNNDRIAEAIAHPERSDEDRKRDITSKPAAVLKLLDLQPGDKVADLFAGRGYYSELIAHIVGGEGEVLAHTVKAYKRFIGDALEERIGDRLPQVKILAQEPNEIDLGTQTLDAAIMVMAYHDMYFSNEEIGWAPIDVPAFMTKLYAALKPGGKLLIVDHAAKDGSGNSEARSLHRIEESFALEDIESYGFIQTGTSDALRNHEDDRSKNVFDDSIRHNTDRFVLLFVKPEK